jgi:DNA polymerase III alpha subunit|tara:strand:+ start:1083 stop:1589 length:507 start_codon:yes stop_codon:yes gene_type:complete
MLDKFKRPMTDETVGIEMLYNNKSFTNTEFMLSDDIKLYNENCAEFDIEKVQILTETDFDRINTYLIPKHYLDIDVEEYINTLVSNRVDRTDNAATSRRVDMELAEYKARNLYPVLRVLIYIIDTMRKNNIVWGIGRGSSIASYVLYLLSVHKVDSIKYNLDIKEFLK